MYTLFSFIIVSLLCLVSISVGAKFSQEIGKYVGYDFCHCKKEYHCNIRIDETIDDLYIKNHQKDSQKIKDLKASASTLIDDQVTEQDNY